MTTSERLREIWHSQPTPFYFVGEKAETREALINDITKKVMGLIRIPLDGKTPTQTELLNLIRGVMPTENDLLKLIKPLIPKVKDGEDGKTPTEKELRSLIEPLIPKVKDGENGKTPTEEDLKNLIRPLILAYMEGIPKEAPKPTYDQIKGVAEPIIRQMMTEARKGWFGGGGSGDNVRAGTGVTITTNNIGAKVISVPGLGNQAYGEEVSGSGTSWTLANTPTAGTVRLFAIGQRLKLTEDYSITGASITTVNSWSAGEILADYSY